MNLCELFTFSIIIQTSGISVMKFNPEIKAKCDTTQIRQKRKGKEKYKDYFTEKKCLKIFLEGLKNKKFWKEASVYSKKLEEFVVKAPTRKFLFVSTLAPPVVKVISLVSELLLSSRCL